MVKMNNGSFYTGIAAGILVGAAVSMVINPMEEKKMRSMKKNVAKTMRTIGAVADTVGMF